ncbi:LuxR C-terminal-related transcriptional regulator [Ulvibacterium sp.]|uniref:helix-turn-helix transcriptional regulator n=1 Tax=Ulvibacterium sp. TaxID=2665914 RepID=UPI0026209E43|nr:LuxR C-terminal-related transcriptional regulator [Ulvibacterium sp.]
MASIWISHQSIQTYNTNFHRNYFYYLITFYAFAFYGIWAQILMRTLLSFMDTDMGIIIMVANFLPLLGIPFLCISWIMLVRMGYSLVEIPINKRVSYFHAIFFVGLIPLAWGLYILFFQNDWLMGRQLAHAEIGLILFVELASLTLLSGVVLHYSKKYKAAKRKVFKLFILLMALAFFIRGALVLFLFSDIWWVAPIILFYFLSNFIPLLYLKLNSDVVFIPVYAGIPNTEKKEMLFKEYRITKREREIVDAICEGKTNQQIADELFISLQTVKDHTHRIYSKIGINSRMKLVQLLSKNTF